MILCVTANAAIDKTAIVRPFRLNEIHRPQELLALPGGKGCNVARALRTLGGDAAVTGWVGGFAGQFIESRLHQEGIETAFVHNEAESRTCLSILDPDSGTLTEVYERGEPVPAAKLDELIALFRALVGQYSAVALSGSLPAGVPVDFYARLVEIARAANVPAYLDASGAALKQGLEARPALIKPNRKEFADLIGGDPASIEAYTAAALATAARYHTTVVLSLGADGAIAAAGDRALHARPPKLTITSAVGSGDCLLAGVLYCLTRGGSPEEALRCGVAAGTANALRLGAGVFTREDYDAILPGVTVEQD